MKRLLLACLLFACRPASAEAFKPFHVLSISGTATLTRFDEEDWPLEAGQDLPGDFTLSLEAGAQMQLRVSSRVDMAIQGPARLRSFVLDQLEGQDLGHDLVLRVEQGDYYFDSRFLLGKPSRIRLDLPDATFDLQSSTRTAMSVDSSRPTRMGELNAELCDFAAQPVPVLVLARDYDQELKAWARPAILGPALMGALKELPGLRLVDGSGTTTLAAYANNAIRSGKDFFVQDMARERGARFVVVGNLVSEEIRDDNLRRTALMSGLAEIRILESDEGGEMVVNDVATTLTARAGRSLEIVGPKIMRATAAKAAAYIRDDMERLLRGEAHAPLLAKVSFNGVSEAWVSELRQGLGGLPSVQRFFKRGFSDGIFRADVMLRGSEADFLAQLQGVHFRQFKLEPDKDSKELDRVYTLRKGPEPTPTRTPKRPKDWRR